MAVMEKKDHQEFSILLEQWSAAIIANDADAIGKFTSDDWRIVDQQGIFSREDFLGSVRGGLLTHDTMRHEVVSVRVFGELSVVVSHAKNTGAFRGERFINDEWVSEVFRKLDGRWLCELTHLTPVKKP